MYQNGNNYSGSNRWSPRTQKLYGYSAQGYNGMSSDNGRLGWTSQSSGADYSNQGWNSNRWSPRSNGWSGQDWNANNWNRWSPRSNNGWNGQNWNANNWNRWSPRSNGWSNQDWNSNRWYDN